LLDLDAAERAAVLLWSGMSRNDAAQTEGNTPMLKWLVLPIVVLAYIAVTASADTPRDRDHDRMPDRWERGHDLSPTKRNGKRDPDGDHLRNRREFRLRTHPKRADTDRDRLRDGAEVRRFHTNPRRKDTDRDGFRDRCELRKGTNPRKRRSRPMRRCSASPGEFPNASNTGVPAGTNLTAYTGPNPVTTDGTVIAGKEIDECLEILAEDVIIRNSLLTCAAYHEDDGVPKSAFLIEDSEIECAGTTASTGLSEADFTARRVEIRSCENGASINRDVLIEDSWIHDLENRFTDPHEDGVQLSFGHFENGNTSTVIDGAENVTLRHNTIEGINQDDSQGTSAIISNPDDGFDVNILIAENLLVGGGTTHYCPRPGQGTKYQVIDNHYDRAPGYGLDDDCGDETHSGNVLHDTGKPVRFGDI
jgi:hypothetical protein